MREEVLRTQTHVAGRTQAVQESGSSSDAFSSGSSDSAGLDSLHRYALFRIFTNALACATRLYFFSLFFSFHELKNETFVPNAWIEIYSMCLFVSFLDLRTSHAPLFRYTKTVINIFYFFFLSGAHV